jgi:excisionase family DNA binding protein
MKLRFYSIAEAMKILGVSRVTIYRQRAAGNIPEEKVGARRLIPGTYFLKMGIDPEKTLGEPLLIPGATRNNA